MKLKNRRIAFLVAEGVEDLEYYVPLMRLKEEGAIVYTAGLNKEPVLGKNGLEIRPDAFIHDLQPDQLDGLVLPGGWAPDKLRRYPEVLQLIKAMHAREKIIGIICHGGLMAISAGIVKGRKATGSLGIKDDLINAGAVWIDEPAFREGSLVWGRVVADIPDFCRELVSALAE